MSRDLMYSEEIHRAVRAAYEVLEEPNAPAARFYTPEQLARLPEGARRWALGVGNPVRHAGLRPGERVVDLGCGSGIDVLLAAMEVAPEGRVTGVDFLPQMVDRARELAAAANLDNVEVREGLIEDLSLEDASVDVVISNGAINLSARKSRVFAEAHRVLRSGGRMCVADLTIHEEDLPPEIITHPSAWAG